MTVDPTTLPRPTEAPARERPSATMTTAIIVALVVAFLSMHGGELVVALRSGDEALLLKAFDHLSAASTSVLAVLAALLAPSPIQR